MLKNPINLLNKFSKFSDHWSPRVVAEMNDYQFKLAKIQNEFTWHSHLQRAPLKNKTNRIPCLWFRADHHARYPVLPVAASWYRPTLRAGQGEVRATA